VQAFTVDKHPLQTETIAVIWQFSHIELDVVLAAETVQTDKQTHGQTAEQLHFITASCGKKRERTNRAIFS